jgi:NAD(P)-dependent dehydrogenase (short-subunit alcohol dehydrogenase family)
MVSPRLLGGKVAIVTGAGQGLGRAHALALAAAGAAVVVNDLDVTLDGHAEGPGSARRVVDEIEAIGGRAVANGADVADDTAAAALVARALEAFGRLDILVNNAGILRDRMIVNMTEEEWDAVIRVHLRGHFCPTRHAVGHWRRQAKDGGPVGARIINTSSPSGVFGAVGQANYGAAKAGISAMTAIAALELARYGVTVNAVAPSARTRMTESAFGPMAAGDGFDPMDPANVAPIVVALSADAAQGITGQTFLVWGGLVSALRPWDLGPVLGADERWEPDDLLTALTETYPAGLRPEGSQPALTRFRGGRSRGG